MSKDRKKQKRKKQQRKRQLSELAKRRPFIDGYDSYAEEYERWKRMDIVKRLVGVYEVSDEQYTKDTQDLLADFGLTSHQQLFYDVEVDNRYSGDSTGDGDDTRVAGGGWTSAVKDQYGRVRPIVFVQGNVPISDKGVPGEEQCNEEIVGVAKLLVLMHELGHAEDISRAVNYDHAALKLDIVAAEIYAHKFVMRHAKRLDYRLALSGYIDNIEEHLNSENAAARLAAEKLCDEVSIEEYKRATRERTGRELERDLQASGRLKKLLASTREGRTDR